jgi:hypothetical protein
MLDNSMMKTYVVGDDSRQVNCKTPLVRISPNAGLIDEWFFILDGMTPEPIQNSDGTVMVLTHMEDHTHCGSKFMMLTNIIQLMRADPARNRA